MAKEKDLCQISLKLFLTNGAGAILGLKAIDQGSYAGFYDLPGGRIDRDEFSAELTEIIFRELQEELGDIEIDLLPVPVAIGRHIIPSALAKNGQETHVVYIFFKAEYVGGNITISAEHQGYEWLDLKNIDSEKYFKSGILEGIKMYLNK